MGKGGWGEVSGDEGRWIGWAERGGDERKRKKQ